MHGWVLGYYGVVSLRIGNFYAVKNAFICVFSRLFSKVLSRLQRGYLSYYHVTYSSSRWTWRDPWGFFEWLLMSWFQWVLSLSSGRPCVYEVECFYKVITLILSFLARNWGGSSAHLALDFHAPFLVCFLSEYWVYKIMCSSVGHKTTERNLSHIFKHWDKYNFFDIVWKFSEIENALVMYRPGVARSQWFPCMNNLCGENSKFWFGICWCCKVVTILISETLM